MGDFICPVDDCQKSLSRLQVMHFRSAHDCDPIDWVTEHYGAELEDWYAQGLGSYTIAEKYEWLSSDMVTQIVNTRTHQKAISDEHNPMKRDAVAEQFTGDNNPAKRETVREKISNAVTGHTLRQEARERISRKNSGNEISAEHREKISAAASNRDTSYMQTAEYSRALSESLKGREPTYPTPYEVAELSHEVRSSWEAEIGKLLLSNDIPYEYEVEFELSIGSYYPDFIVDTHVIEVKGFSDERSVNKATSFMQEFPTYTYLVVGDEIPCDRHIPWERRGELPEVLTDD